MLPFPEQFRIGNTWSMIVFGLDITEFEYAYRMDTSAASIPIALCEAQEQGVLKKGGTVLLVGFGAGLTWSSIVLKWSK